MSVMKTLPYNAYVLAAGQSRRFGSNKAFAPWQGVPFLTHQLQLLQSYFDTVKVVAPAPDTYQALGITSALVDRFPGQGPLAGLDTALQDLHVSHGNTAWLFLASCDTFDVRAKDILTLAQALPEATGTYQAVLWKHHQRLEPLWGFYAVTLGSTVYQRLKEGRLPMHELLADIPVKSYARSRGWIQVNTSADLSEKA